MVYHLLRSLDIFRNRIYALVQQIDKGHIVTGMRDNVVWVSIS